MTSYNSFWSDIVEKYEVKDLFLISSVPIVLSLIFLLPVPIQNALMLDHGNYSVLNLWTSAFVHNGYDHFINNVLAYCLLITPIYLLLALGGERKLFHGVFLTFLFVLPFVIGLANVVAFGSGTGAGFSGVGSAFFGLLPVSIFVFIHNRISEEIVPANGVFLFMIAGASIALTYSSTSVALGILIFAVLLVVYDLYHLGIEMVKEVGLELVSMEGYFELVVVSSLLFLISPALLFPPDIVKSDSVVNIFSHYLGLLVGFFIPTLYLYYRRRRQ